MLPHLKKQQQATQINPQMFTFEAEKVTRCGRRVKIKLQTHELNSFLFNISVACLWSFSSYWNDCIFPDDSFPDVLPDVPFGEAQEAGRQKQAVKDALQNPVQQKHIDVP